MPKFLTKMTFNDALSIFQRSSGKSLDSGTPKRPRVPKEFDIPELAKSGNLKKANIESLKSWLIANGNSVKSKSKKEDLIKLVTAKLGLEKNDALDTIFEP